MQAHIQPRCDRESDRTQDQRKVSGEGVQQECVVELARGRRGDDVAARRRASLCVIVGTIVFFCLVFVMNHNGAVQHPAWAADKERIVQFTRLVRLAKESDISTLQKEGVKTQLQFMREIRLVSILRSALRNSPLVLETERTFRPA